jgi:hypothetical protein
MAIASFAQLQLGKVMKDIGELCEIIGKTARELPK